MYQHSQAHVRAQARADDVCGLVSVIMPIYNQARWLEEAVRAVLCQEYLPGVELIVVDDGSENDWYGRLHHRLSDDRITWVRKDHAGIGRALTVGQQLARGEYVTWVSADNILGKGNIAALVEGLAGDEGAVLCYTDYRVIDEDGLPLYGSAFRRAEQDKRDSSVIRVPRSPVGLGFGDNVVGPSFLYRRSASRQLGGYETALGAEDFDYWLRMYEIGRVIYVDPPSDLYQYRVHSGSVSARAVDLKIREKVELIMSARRLRNSQRARCRRGAGSTSDSSSNLVDLECDGDRALWVGTEAELQVALELAQLGEISHAYVSKPDWAYLFGRPGWPIAPTKAQAGALHPLWRHASGIGFAFADHHAGERLFVQCKGHPSMVGGRESVARSVAVRAAVRFDLVSSDIAEVSIINYPEEKMPKSASPVVVVLHGTHAGLPAWEKDFLERNLERADLVVAVSTETALYALANYPVQATRLRVIPNGIDTHAFPMMSKDQARKFLGLDGNPLRHIWITPGAIYPPKGQLIAVKAFEQVATGDDTLLLVGETVDPSYAREVRRVVEKLRERGLSIEILPARDDMNVVYRAADYLLQPSFSEGWSLVLGEAIFCGLGVVATGVGAANELLAVTGAGIAVTPLVDASLVNGRNFSELCEEHNRDFLRFSEAMLRVQGGQTPVTRDSLISRSHNLQSAADEYMAEVECLFHSNLYARSARALEQRP